MSRGDVTDAGSVARVGAGHEAAISAVGPSREGGDPAMLVAAARALLTGLAQAGVPLLVVAGGAGSLEVAPGVRLVDTPEFRPAWRPLALAHADALEALRSADTDVAWSYASPAALLAPGERTGRYRVGGDQLLTDAAGDSSLSMEDFAIALVDEAEQPRHVRARFSVAN